MKIFLWIMILLWASAELFRAARKYRENREKTDLLSIIASCITIPAGIVLLIAEIAG